MLDWFWLAGVVHAVRAIVKFLRRAVLLLFRTVRQFGLFFLRGRLQSCGWGILRRIVPASKLKIASLLLVYRLPDWLGGLQIGFLVLIRLFLLLLASVLRRSLPVGALVGAVLAA